MLLSTLFLNISLIWEKINELRRNIKKPGEDKNLSQDAKKKLKQIFEEEINKVKEEILKELPDKILEKSKLEKGRRYEIRNQINISLKAIFGWFEMGVELDITPVRMAEPEEAPE